MRRYCKLNVEISVVVRVATRDQVRKARVSRLLARGCQNGRRWAVWTLRYGLEGILPPVSVVLGPEALMLCCPGAGACPVLGRSGGANGKTEVRAEGGEIPYAQAQKMEPTPAPVYFSVDRLGL